MKSNNIIIGGVVAGIIAFLYFKSKKTTSIKTEESTTTDDSSSGGGGGGYLGGGVSIPSAGVLPIVAVPVSVPAPIEQTGGTSIIADVPIVAPIVKAPEQAPAPVVVTPPKPTDAELKAIEDQKIAEAKRLAEARAISAKIAQDKINIVNYKKASSRANVQAEIDKNTAILRSMGYIPLPNGDVQKL